VETLTGDEARVAEVADVEWPKPWSSDAANDGLSTFTDPHEAGPDFLIHGEYVGKVGGELDIAAQVIAGGDGKFEGVLYGGGMPGAG